mgnify:CR=1 FL=1
MNKYKSYIEYWERDKIVNQIVDFCSYYFNDVNDEFVFDPPLENENIKLLKFNKKQGSHLPFTKNKYGTIEIYDKKPDEMLDKPSIREYFIEKFTLQQSHLYTVHYTNVSYNTAKNILELLKGRYPEYFEGDKFGFFEHLKTFKKFESVKDRNNLVRENLEGFFNYFKDENNKVVFDPPIFIEDDFIDPNKGVIFEWENYIRYFLLFEGNIRIYYSKTPDSIACDGFFSIGLVHFNACLKIEEELLKRDEYSWYFEGLKFNITEKITLDIEEGDVLMGGKFKNKQVKVKEIGKDDKNQPTINGKPLLKFRIFKQLPQKDKKRIKLK